MNNFHNFTHQENLNNENQINNRNNRKRINKKVSRARVVTPNVSRDIIILHIYNFKGQDIMRILDASKKYDKVPSVSTINREILKYKKGLIEIKINGKTNNRPLIISSSLINGINQIYKNNNMQNKNIQNMPIDRSSTTNCAENTNNITNQINKYKETNITSNLQTPIINNSLPQKPTQSDSHKCNKLVHQQNNYNQCVINNKTIPTQMKIPSQNVNSNIFGIFQINNECYEKIQNSIYRKQQDYTSASSRNNVLNNCFQTVPQNYNYLTQMPITVIDQRSNVYDVNQINNYINHQEQIRNYSFKEPPLYMMNNGKIYCNNYPTFNYKN